VILAAGLSPAWQQILVFDSMRWGEVNRADQVLWCGSGKVLNVGIAAHTLGGPARTLSPLGGPALESVNAEMVSLGVRCRWIETHAATRVCTTIIDRGRNQITELVENARPLGPDELRAFRTAFIAEAAPAEVVALTGSLPEGAPQTYYRELLLGVKARQVLDFRGIGLLSVLDLKPWLVKPNREELSQTFGKPIDSDAALLQAMRELNRRGAQWVAVSQGPGPVWLASATRAFRLQPPKPAEIVNSIGCGDAMTAGIAWASCQGYDAIDCIRIGMAAACDNLSQLLPCRLDARRVRELTRRVLVTICE
jgi:1-phosphofructokinase family hexose kinase